MDEQEESEVVMCSDQMKPSASIEFFRWLGNGMISRLRHRSGVVSLAGQRPVELKSSSTVDALA